ncbi:hypothetical protein [Rothia nasimurium]|uniref:hypothetical protein n=1 Tax=Rothia nasimurium TaxID=85336 RepID=UPI001F3A04B3|nr:hypothetical protein [Rothia nasimurium]
MSINRYTPELHAKFRELLTPDILDGTITINYGNTYNYDFFTNLPRPHPTQQNKPELHITGLIAAVPALLDEIDRLNEQVAQAWTEGYTRAAAHYHLADGYAHDPEDFTHEANSQNPHKEQTPNG